MYREAPRNEIDSGWHFFSGDETQEYAGHPYLIAITVSVAVVAGLHLHTFASYARLSGQVPVVGIVAGRCFAGNAALLGCSDVIIATRDSNIGMGGPAMIEGGGLGIFRPEEVGPVDVQAPNGVIDVLVEDEEEAVRVAKGFGNFQEVFFIRGFPAYSDDMTYNGLYGVLPRQFVAAELLERVPRTPLPLLLLGAVAERAPREGAVLVEVAVGVDLDEGGVDVAFVRRTVAIAAVVLVVGARPSGQASFATLASRFTSASLPEKRARNHTCSWPRYWPPGSAPSP